MSRALCPLLALGLASVALAQRTPPPPDRPARASSFLSEAAASPWWLLQKTPPKRRPSEKAEPAAHEQSTRCELCHTTAGWLPARFSHERTGFPLEGEHAKAGCRACHRVGGFDEPLGQRCSGCHRDPHRGTLGQSCEGCHDALSWQSRFGPDAHRRTAFPLEGRHAIIPCAECHGEALDPRLARPIKGCADCHLDDYQRTLGSALDHPALGFSTECARCHQPSRFSPARFPEHDRCFPLGGDHARVSCSGCHLTPPPASTLGSCASGTATCTSCHTHSCGRTAEEHREVPGYECLDRKCYECHRGSGP